jgi:hypothetical protein
MKAVARHARGGGILLTLELERRDTTSGNDELDGNCRAGTFLRLTAPLFCSITANVVAMFY